MSSLLTFDEVLYAGPSEVIKKEFDFEDEADGDTLDDIGSGSTIEAVDQDGTSVGSTILSAKARSGTVLSAKVGSMTAGNDYLVTFTAKKGTSDEILQKFLLVRCRTRSIVI